MKKIKLYSPNGKGEAEVHAHQVENLKSKGWTEKPAKQVKQKKVEENGDI